MSNVYSLLIGAAVALISGYGLEMIRSWQQRRASWHEMQAIAMTELQELLGEVKNLLAKGEPSRDGAPAPHAPNKSDLQTFAPRTRARMLCSRLSDQQLAKNVSDFLANLKNDGAEWRTSWQAWYDDQEKFTNYANDDLGSKLRAHKPWWVKA